MAIHLPLGASSRSAAESVRCGAICLDSTPREIAGRRPVRDGASLPRTTALEPGRAVGDVRFHAGSETVHGIRAGIGRSAPSLIDSDEMRDVIGSDMSALRTAGNTFRIRHHETDAVGLAESDRDYLAGRTANLPLMLRASNRLGKP